MEQQKRLDSHYFSTTPKSSRELFKWIFTEPKKLIGFTELISRRKCIVLIFKIYIYIVILSCIIYIIFNFIVSYFNLPALYPSFFYDTITLSWNEYISVFEKFIFLLQVLGVTFIKSLVSALVGSFTVVYVIALFTSRIESAFVGALAGGLVIGLSFGCIVSFSDNFADAIIFGIFLGLVVSFMFSFFLNFIFVLLICFVFSLIVYSVSSFIVCSVFCFAFVVSYYFIVFGLHLYLYYFLRSQLQNISLTKNPYLQNSYIFFPIWGVTRKLADSTFSNPILANDFIKFLFNFRPYQRKLAFYLSNVENASKLYNDKLESNGIKIPKEYEKHQPTQSFIITLQKLKDKLGIYKTETNIHDKVDSIQQIIEILKDLEQQMIIEQRGWSEYYLKAIKANLNEAIARLQNDKMEAKRQEPISKNIYEIGSPLSPNYQNQLFKGRKDVVDRLSNIIYTSQQMPLLLIQGQRRVGKTSLINYLEQLLGSGFKIVKLDMQSATNKEFGSLVKNINQELNSMLGIDETIETSDNIMQSWIAFEEYLTKHTKALNYKIIIAFDEYESFHEYIVQKHGKTVLENMRSFIQSQNQVIFLFAGMLRISDLTSPNWDEYFPQAQRLKVDYLSQDESFELITHPVDDFNLVYSDEVADEVYRWTMGHPQLLQTICSNIVTIVNKTNQKIVTSEMVAEAKDEVFEINDMPMTIFWREFCGDEERKIMEQILANKAIIRETKEQRRALARLIDYGFVVKFGAEASDSMQYKIRVPLFEKWLIERRDLVKT